MNIQNLTLVVTDDCNFDCTYCYRQKSHDRISSAAATKALSVFLPFLTDAYSLNFYGGEPLLRFDVIEETLAFLETKNKHLRKKPLYSLTTNGSLITDDILKTLETYKFSIVFSFDGYAQEIHRKDGSFDLAVANIKKILERPDIKLDVNSVFTPRTIGHVSDSMAFIMDLGVSSILLSFSLTEPWDNSSLGRMEEEMAKLGEILLAHYEDAAEIPIQDFRKRESQGYFYCAGGQDRMAVTPDEHVWGCDLFADYFRGKAKGCGYQDYCFGDLDSFAKNHKEIYPKVSANYARLAMDNFSTPRKACLFCSEMENCTVCPMVAAMSGAPLGEIPVHVCDIQKIRIAERRKFQEKILEVT